MTRFHGDPKRYPCQCCGYYTLVEPPPGTWAICRVCWWEDDDRDVESDVLGANRVTLRQARGNYRTTGASDARFLPHVRPPKPEELPENNT